MGFLSKVWKGVKNIFKGVGKAVKKVFKEVKRFVKSDVGKIIIASAAIYFGGQALGYWGEAAPSMQASTIAGQNTFMSAGELGANSVLAPGQTAADAVFATQGGATAAQGVAASANAGMNTGNALTKAEQVLAANASTPVAGEGLKQSQEILAGVKPDPSKTWFGKSVDWATENPLLAIAGGNFLSTALAPDPVEEQMRLEEWRRSRSNIAGIYGDGTGKPVQIQGLVGRAADQTPTYARGRNNGTG